MDDDQITKILAPAFLDGISLSIDVLQFSPRRAAPHYALQHEVGGTVMVEIMDHLDAILEYPSNSLLDW
jgi:hypothetical protein